MPGRNLSPEKVDSDQTQYEDRLQRFHTESSVLNLRVFVCGFMLDILTKCLYVNQRLCILERLFFIDIVSTCSLQESQTPCLRCTMPIHDGQSCKQMLHLRTLHST